MKNYAILAVLMFATAFAHAVPTRGIRSPVDVVVNTMGEYEERWYPEENMINKSGLLTPFIDGVTDFTDYVYTAPLHEGWDDYSWLSAYIYSGELIFDMGREYRIWNFMMWNGGTGISASPAAFTVTTSRTLDFSEATVVGTFTGHQRDYVGTEYWITPSIGRYVKLSIDGNFGNPCCVAIGEVAFDAELLHPIPEPGSVTLAGIGLTALGAVALARRLRERRQAVRAG
ncbi:MAG: hypothetical protein AB1584_22355 [Pseudomonadota bacterium]